MKRIFSVVMTIVFLLSLFTYADESWVCPSCGREGNTGAFCGKCGTRKPEETAWVCPECGREGNTENFCPKCGTRKPAAVKSANASNSFVENVHYVIEDNILCLIKGCEVQYLNGYLDGCMEVLAGFSENEEGFEFCLYSEKQLSETNIHDYIAKLDSTEALFQASYTGLLSSSNEADIRTLKTEVQLAVLLNSLPLYIYVVAQSEEDDAQNTQEIEEPAKPATFSVTTSRAANVRKGPGLSYQLIGSVQPGQTVDAYALVSSSDFSGNWYRIDYNGQEGYISASTANSYGQQTAQITPAPTAKPTAHITPKPTATPTKTAAPTTSAATATATASVKPTTVAQSTPTPTPTLTPTPTPTPTTKPTATTTTSTTCEHDMQWVSAGQAHRQVCTKCGYASGYTEHTTIWVSDGTAGHHQSCTLCGYRGGTIQAHVALGGFKLVNDGDKHHYECIDCGYAKEQTNHSAGVKAIPGDDVWHERVCDCGYSFGVEKHDRNGKFCASGMHYTGCSTCRFRFDVYDGEHPSVTYVPSGSRHYTKCDWCRNAVQYEDHTFENGVCTKCGKTQ